MQDTAVCSEPVSQASRATMGLSQARAGTCQVLFMGGSGPLMDVPYAFMGVPGLCMALACTEAVYAG